MSTAERQREAEVREALATVGELVKQYGLSWEEDAFTVLEAFVNEAPAPEDVRAEALTEFMENWYDRWAGPGEQWTLADMAAGIVEAFDVRRKP